MRIALMHRQLAGGGTEADLRRMATGLVERGHEVHVFCARPNAEVPGVHLRRVRIPRLGRAARVLAFALLAPRLVSREHFDVVVGFGRTPSQDVARIGGGTHRSYLETMRDSGGRGRGGGPYHRAILWIERRQFAVTGHRCVVAVAGRVRDEIVRDYGVAASRIRVLYNGVDTTRFHPAKRATLGPAFRAAVRCPDDEHLCVAIGSGFERKGMDLLLTVWETAAPERMRLAIVGDDERLAAYRRRAAAGSLSGRVVVMGPRADVDAVLAGADVLCVPSRQEAFGNVVLEACAAGVPVVTTRAVGAAELLTGPLGELVAARSGDLQALGHLLARAVGPRRQVYAQSGRALAESRPWARHVDELEQLLVEVARG